MECPASLFDKPPPQKNLTRSFLTCAGSVSIEAKINSNVFYPQENIMVKVEIKNNASRDIKRLKIKLVQISQVPMFQDGQVRDKTICKVDDPLSLPPGALTTREFVLVPDVPSKPAHGEIFLQSTLKGDDGQCLAPSTLVPPSIKKADLFGVHVAYVVRIKATLGALVGDAILDVPFVLAVQQGVSSRALWKNFFFFFFSQHIFLFSYVENCNVFVMPFFILLFFVIILFRTLFSYFFICIFSLFTYFLSL
ncbi:Phosrestin-1 [Chionoecetes opilio]|uniref:Phosrestin-1 n=1 Tax=Chionoecetes opilio TaxID=41210 RepID=A0A8J4YHL7_CHIOP|nr:Phosrestin-1 [Chionoecetes opilio]